MLTILRDMSGVMRPSKMTLLLGSPSSGKTALLLALVCMCFKLVSCPRDMHAPARENNRREESIEEEQVKRAILRYITHVCVDNCRGQILDLVMAATRYHKL
jgi:Ni2+-binding GTPase involved in maturation of urease and hydrogenase